MKTLADFNWQGKIAVIRTDLNVPLAANGEVADSARLDAAAPTVRAVLAGGGGAVVLSHLGRPREGAADEALSLKQVAAAFADALQHPVNFCPSFESVRAAPGGVLLLENTRFNVGEKANDSNLARRYAALGDVFVMDAFASAHRAEASVEALARAGIPACAGVLLTYELIQLQRVTSRIVRPFVGIFGGAKISTKLALLRQMAALCDTLIIGGGMANTLLAAAGQEVGASLAQDDMRAAAQGILAEADGRLMLPQDVVVGARGQPGREVALADIAPADCILDIGSASAAQYAGAVAQAKTVVWNGPLGLFEEPAYAGGTAAVARAVADSAAYSLVGGADTIAALRAAGVLERISHVSTGGGAMLEYLAGKSLPGVAALAA